MDLDIYIKSILSEQRIFRKTQNNLSAEWRLLQLLTLEKLLLQNEDAIIFALKEDLNKSPEDSYVSEIAPVYAELEFTKKHLKQWMRPVHDRSTILNAPSKNYYYYHPHGSSLIVGPWNYPVGLLLVPLVSSIAAGNTTILKPSELGPKTSSLLATLFSKYFSKSVCAIVEGGAESVENIIENGTNFVFFTGGTKTGTKILHLCAEQTIPSALELSGCNPCIVDYKADISAAARRIACGKFFNAGQTCLAPNICFIPEKDKSEFLHCLRTSIKHQFSGESYTRIVNEFHFKRIVKMANSEGNIIYGGEHSIATLSIEPTVIELDNINSQFLTDEIFGPLLPLFFYSNLDDVLSKIERSTPLALYFFSKNKTRCELVKNSTISGNLCFNGTLHQIFETKLPFGGVGKSGMGRYHGKSGFETFSYTRSILHKHPTWEIPLIYPPTKTPLSILKKATRVLFHRNIF